MYTILLLVGLSTIYLTIQVALVLLRNHKAHKFFAKKSPKLPVVPDPNLFAGHALRITSQPKNWKIIEDLHEKYGPTFGHYMCDQPWVSTKDLDLIKLIEIDETHKHINRAFLGLPFQPFNHSLWHLEDDKWRQMRRTMSPSLSNLSVRGESISQQIETAVNKVMSAFKHKADGKPAPIRIEVRDYFERYSLDIILATAYDQRDLVDFNADQDAMTQLIHSAGVGMVNPFVALSVAFPFLRPLCKLMVKFHVTGQSERKIVRYIMEATEKRSKLLDTGAEKDAAKRSLMSVMADNYLNKRISKDLFTGNLLFLLLAAFTTTADTIACLMWQLARNPDAQEKLRKAILEEGIDADYVTWCIHETVRFHPGVPLGTGRVLSEDVTVDGLFLAKGTYVMPTTHGIHHDPKIWPEPERFMPERWRDRASFHPAQFMGFGLGPRNCIGRQLALHAIKLLMCRILSNYRIETCDQTPDEWNFSSPGMLFCTDDNPVIISFRPIMK